MPVGIWMNLFFGVELGILAGFIYLLFQKLPKAEILPHVLFILAIPVLFMPGDIFTIISSLISIGTCIMIAKFIYLTP